MQYYEQLDITAVNAWHDGVYRGKMSLKWNLYITKETCENTAMLKSILYNILKPQRYLFNHSPSSETPPEDPEFC